MKAIVYTKYGPPEVLKLEETDKPVPKDDAVLVKIYATTVSATDSIFRKGKPFISRSATGFIKPKNTIPGDVFSGEIEMVGKNVTIFKQNDIVYGATGGSFGTYAEYICLPEKGTLAIKPSNVSHEEAAAICESSLTALPFIRDTGNLRKGQKILINGASGSIGSIAVQLAKYYGADVTGVCSTSNVEMVNSLGADRVIDYTKDDFSKDSGMYDIIFDTVGKSSFSVSKNALKSDGIYLSTVMTFGIMLQMLKTLKTSAKKAKIAFTGLRPADERAKDLVFLKELVETGKIKAVVDRTYPIEQIVEAHHYVDKGHKKGNVVITVTK